MYELSSQHARYCLEQLGLRVTDVPVAPPAKRADLRAWWASEEYIVEAKERHPHPTWKSLRSTADSDGSASMSRRVGVWSALTGAIKDSYEQLVATDGSEHALRVMWWVAPHDDAAFVTACMEKRLLGTEPLFAVEGPDGLGRHVDCYHHAPPRFEQCPRMAGAVLTSLTGARLYVNYYSPERARFRESYLYRTFRDRNAVVDPEVEVAAGRALMIADDFEGGRDGTRQWSYIREKYGLLTSVGIDSQFDGMLVIRADAFMDPE